MKYVSMSPMLAQITLSASYIKVRSARDNQFVNEEVAQTERGHISDGNDSCEVDSYACRHSVSTGNKR